MRNLLTLILITVAVFEYVSSIESTPCIILCSGFHVKETSTMTPETCSLVQKYVSCVKDACGSGTHVYTKLVDKIKGDHEEKKHNYVCNIEY